LAILSERLPRTRPGSETISADRFAERCRSHLVTDQSAYRQQRRPTSAKRLDDKD
jgi:hypothetical protein